MPLSPPGRLIDRPAMLSVPPGNVVQYARVAPRTPSHLQYCSGSGSDQAPSMLEGGNLGLGDLGVLGKAVGRVTRLQVHQHEAHDRDADQDGYGLQAASDYVLDHGSRSYVREGGGPCGPVALP